MFVRDAARRRWEQNIKEAVYVRRVNILNVKSVARMVAYRRVSGWRRRWYSNPNATLFVYNLLGQTRVSARARVDLILDGML